MIITVKLIALYILFAISILQHLKILKFCYPCLTIKPNNGVHTPYVINEHNFIKWTNIRNPELYSKLQRKYNKYTLCKECYSLHFSSTHFIKLLWYFSVNAIYRYTLYWEYKFIVLCSSRYMELDCKETIYYFVKVMLPDMFCEVKPYCIFRTFFSLRI